MLSEMSKKLIRMLATDNDAEAEVCRNKLKNSLKADGHDFNDLADGRCFTPGMRGTHQEDTYKARTYWHSAPLAALIALGAFRFSDKEWDFLTSLQNWRGEITEKQAAWLKKIIAKHLARA